MATISSIGTASRNYSTIQAWHDAFATGGWIGECYNDSEFLVTATITFSGKAVTATDYLWLRCATGQSFRDNASVQTNAFAYNQTNGVGIRCNTGFTSTIELNETNTGSTITLSGLQISYSASNGNSNGTVYCPGTSTITMEDCIVEGAGDGASNTMLANSGFTQLCRNCLFMARGDSSGIAISSNFTTITFANCTIVSTVSGGSATGIAFNTSTNAHVTNCAIFGFSTNVNVSGTVVGSNNASDNAITFGSANQASKTYANQFVTITDTGRNFALKSGADCVNNGTTDTTDIPASDDAVKTTRPWGGVWDIGAWELQAGSPPGSGAIRMFPIQGIGLSIGAAAGGALMRNPVVTRRKLLTGGAED